MRKNQRKGFGIVYAVIVMFALVALASLAVDFGRVQIVKTQLRAAADAAARAAGHDLQYGTSIARDAAVKYAKANKADGKDVALDRNADIEFGNWVINPATNKGVFTKSTSTDVTKLNAVRVVTKRIAARQDAVPLMLANVIGKGSLDVTAETIVMVIPGIKVDQYVPATANPFLAGMPKGSVASLNNPHKSPDYAGDASNPRQSPIVVKMPIDADGRYTFDSIDGTARHDPNLPYFNPDGEMSDIGRNTNGSENGIGDIRAPINSLVGVFLSDEQPNLTAAPAATDASSESAREQLSYSPKLKQMFFIGDGMTKDGTRQEYIAPPGATRLFLATWDFFEWNNNAGYRNVKVNRPARVITVK